jgi:hypothetical protein
MNWQQAQVKPMSEIRKGVSWGSLLALIGLAAMGVYLVYQATHTNTSNTAYAKGADHVETNLTVAPVENNYPLAFPRCGKTFSIDPNWANQPKAKK